MWKEIPVTGLYSVSSSGSGIDQNIWKNLLQNFLLSEVILNFFALERDIAIG